MFPKILEKQTTIHQHNTTQHNTTQHNTTNTNISFLIPNVHKIQKYNLKMYAFMLHLDDVNANTCVNSRNIVGDTYIHMYILTVVVMKQVTFIGRYGLKHNIFIFLF